jgi:hypothetical protein
MNPKFSEYILETTCANDFQVVEKIQNLWSDYGKIIRIQLDNSIHNTIIAKYIRLPQETHHPRGWNTNNSHARKIKSYRVEEHWYKKHSRKTSANCRVPRHLGSLQLNNESIILMEDLDHSGYAKRIQTPSSMAIKICIKWLANFHMCFLKTIDEELWSQGSYWHLKTRPDELKALKDIRLKKAAHKIDLSLDNITYKTLIHGDAKLANFCFNDIEDKVAAVDFQYIGMGCGMKDLAYFIGSCLTEDQCESQEEILLDYYFKEAEQATLQLDNNINIKDIEQEWRPLYHNAWADFHRFLKGWSPNHWKINSYSEKICEKVITELS